jgi:predicted porin
MLTSVSLASLGAAAAAHAQSSVTLYGAIDNSITYIRHADGSQNRWSLGNSANGNLSGTRWGLKGAEDLGGGLKAIFQLENGFNPSTGALGQGGRMFGRQAYVGLTAQQIGSLTLGRQYDPLVDLVQGITADNYFGSAFATPGDVDNYDNSFRVNNTVKYTTPTWNGLQVSAMYAFGGVAGTVSGQQSYAAAVAYSNGPFSLAGGYFFAANRPAVEGIRSSGADGWTSTSDGTFNGPINIGYASAHSLSIARAAAQYVLGPFTLGLGYSNSQYAPDGSSLFRDTQRYNTGQGFFNYQLNPALLLGIGYSYTRANGDTSAIYHQVSIGADYNLSKRTDIYMTAAWQHASGETSDGAGGTMPAEASIGSYGYPGTSTQKIINLGLRHKF